MLHDVQHSFEQFHDVEFTDLQLEVATFKVRKIEQVVDQADQHVATTLDRMNVLALLACQVRQVQEIRHAKDSI